MSIWKKEKDSTGTTAGNADGRRKVPEENEVLAKRRRKDTGRGKKKKKSGVSIPVLIFLVCISYATCWAICSSLWVFSQWSNLKMEEIVYELNAPLTGTGSGMVGDYLRKCVFPGFVVVAAELLLILPKRKKLSGRICRNAAIVTTIACAGVFLWFGYRVDFYRYVQNSFSDSDFIEKYYADPAETDITFPEKKRNLIYIYLESMEVTYSDRESGGGFDENCIPELTQLARDNEDFSGSGTWTEEEAGGLKDDTEDAIAEGQDKNQILNGGYALSGCTWTMGAMFGTSTGLPLKAGSDNEEMASVDSFFPGMTALGDILEEEGYNQVLSIGSDATFGGRRQFYTDHGNYEIMDYNSAQEEEKIPEDYYVWWGFEDEKLFSFSKERLTQLAEEDEPFNFTMLTVDTHFPDGYVCDLCKDEFGDNQYANVMACSSRQVTDFVKWCQQQDWYDNTTIVITGDHPTMDADFCEDVDSSYTRKTYTCYINSAVQPVDGTVRREYTTLDEFPTILAAMGAEIDGERLGLGTNLFSDTQTLSEIYGYSYVSNELSKKSEFLTNLENVDDSVHSVSDRFSKLDAPEASVTISQSDGEVSENGDTEGSGGSPSEGVRSSQDSSLSGGSDRQASDGGQLSADHVDRQASGSGSQQVSVTFLTDNLRNYDENILGVRIRIWYEKEGGTTEDWIDLEKRSDGKWTGTFTASSEWFGGTDTVHYQAYVNCLVDEEETEAQEEDQQEETGYVDLGKEGTFRPFS